MWLLGPCLPLLLLLLLHRAKTAQLLAACVTTVPGRVTSTYLLKVTTIVLLLFQLTERAKRLRPCHSFCFVFLPRAPRDDLTRASAQCRSAPNATANGVAIGRRAINPGLLETSQNLPVLFLLRKPLGGSETTEHHTLWWERKSCCTCTGTRPRQNTPFAANVSLLLVFWRALLLFWLIPPSCFNFFFSLLHKQRS